MIAARGYAREATLLAEGAGARLALAAVGEYPDGELKVTLPPIGRDAKPVVVMPAAASWEAIGLALMALEAASELGLEPELFMPMMPYARSDKAPRGEACVSRLVGGAISAAGAASAIAIAPHSDASLAGLDLPVTAIEPLPAMAEACAARFRPDGVLAPDMGAVPRAKAVAAALGGLPVAAVRKTRLASGKVKAVSLVGKVGRRTLLVDDIVATGGTFVAAAAIARRHGAERFLALAVHGTFGDRPIADLRKAGIERLCLSDTVRFSRRPGVTTIPILGAVGRSLYAV